MIKKLDKNLASNINSCNMSQNIMVAHKAIEKINELVDAVNELQKNATISKMEKVEPADPHAEQRKWIGKLCWFWDDEYVLKTVGVLEEISPIDEEFIYTKKDSRTVWKHCELVKLDDDIIYKGA